MTYTLLPSSYGRERGNGCGRVRINTGAETGDDDGPSDNGETGKNDETGETGESRSGGRAMRITRMETFIVEAGVACWVFLKLYTDEGVTGLGDCTLESKEHTVLGALKDVAPLVVGKDPTAIERLWQELYRLSPWQGVGLFTAMSGIEQAMWDITGKTYGQPVYRLLGGACRDRLRLYTWPQPTSDTPEGYAEGALEAVAQGYGALKTDPFGDSFFTVTPQQIERAISRVAAMRDAVGPDVAIAVDGHQRFYPQSAIAIARELEPLDVLFFEEPVPSDNLDALAKVSEGLRQLRVPLATGERHFTRWAFRPILERQLVDIVQPDVCHVGGLWELRKIAAMAEPYGVPIAPHNPNGPVGLAAAAHVGFCTPNFLALESTHTRAWQWDLVTPPLTIERGHVLRPDRPGLGFELDEDAVRRRAGTPRPMDFWRRIVVE